MIATVNLSTGLHIVGAFAVIALIFAFVVWREARRPETPQERRVRNEQAARHLQEFAQDHAGKKQVGIDRDAA